MANDSREHGSTTSSTGTSSTGSAVHESASKAKEFSNALSSASKTKGNGAGSCCGLISRGRKLDGAQNVFKQAVLLVRHSERLDYVDKEYSKTPEGQEWPWDAPLTARGWILAREVAAEFAALQEEMKFALIATSPYRRCVETAMAIAKASKLPIVLDQEIGEVWERKMGDEKLPWRSPQGLQEMLKGYQVLNPLLPEGGYKLFGRKPTFPETLSKARSRMVVRFDTYIRQSESLHQNFIICTHADGLAAALNMFERGSADVSGIDFCSRILAKRIPKDEESELNSYAKHWHVEPKGIEMTKFEGEGSSKKLYESMHLDECEATEKEARARRSARTKTDKMFDENMQALLRQAGEQTEDDDSVDQDDDGANKLQRSMDQFGTPEPPKASSFADHRSASGSSQAWNSESSDLGALEEHQAVRRSELLFYRTGASQGAIPL